MKPKPRFIVLTIMARIVRSLAPLATIVLVLVSCTSPPITGVASPTVGPPAAIEATQVVTATPTAGVPDSTVTPPAAATLTPLEAREVEAYAVYGAVIQTRTSDTQEPALVVIRDQTTPGAFPGELGEYLESMREGLPGLTDEIGADFELQNEQPLALKPLLTLGVDYVFISQEEIETTFAQTDGWDRFYAAYPGAQGHMRLSGVGFNSQMDAALVYVDNMSGPLAGEGYFVLLKKVDGEWTIQGQTMVWIS